LISSITDSRNNRIYSRVGSQLAGAGLASLSEAEE
jgi:hypothetical protein